jgi:hypothetical protein
MLKTMNQTYRLFLRPNGVFYSQECETGKQHSLKTKNKAEAVRLLNAKNEAAQNPLISHFSVAPDPIDMLEDKSGRIVP